MPINKQDFNCITSEKTLFKCSLFRYAIFLLLVFYFGFIIYSLLSNKINHNNFVLFILPSCFIVMAAIIVYNSVLDKNIIKIIAQMHGWKYVKKYYGEKYSSWDYIKDLKKLEIFGSLWGTDVGTLIIGKIANREFNLEYFPDSLREGTDKYLVIVAAPIKNFKRTILIKPKINFVVEKMGNLYKKTIETQGLFDVYTDNPETFQQDVSEEFVSELISYFKNIDKEITIFITHKGILCIKKIYDKESFPIEKVFQRFKIIFSAPEKYIKCQWAKYENFINLIEIINLLEPKK